MASNVMAFDSPGTALATACDWPAWTTTGLRNGIFARRSAPTCSIWWPRSRSRSSWNSPPPASWTAIQRVANAPDWMSARTSCIAAFAPSVTRGPET